MCVCTSRLHDGHHVLWATTNTRRRRQRRPDASVQVDPDVRHGLLSELHNWYTQRSLRFVWVSRVQDGSRVPIFTPRELFDSDKES